MTPYASLSYVILLIGVLAPVTVAGLLGRADWRWTVAALAAALLVEYGSRDFAMLPNLHVPELVALVVYAIFQLCLQKCMLRRQRAGKSRWWLILLALLPLVLAKLQPAWVGGLHFGYAGVSYVTFRVLDVLWAISSGSLKAVGTLDFVVYAFFFPTISSGPIDRFKRFNLEWRKRRTRQEFLDDLDEAVPLIFKGLLYKNILASILEKALHHSGHSPGIVGIWTYAWIYSVHLYFDFAGYSAFAIGVGRWFGIRSPENFSRPWAASNIRDFWARWHMSLSTWFRDHIYSRFIMISLKRKWFQSMEMVSALGFIISFGIMGLWHGLAWNYIVYGLYHAALMIGYEAFLRWKKRHPESCTSAAWNLAARVITLHVVVFGMWIFSGRGYISYQAKVPPPIEVPAEDGG